MSLSATGAAPEICIPDASGVPGSSGPPDWWTNGQIDTGGAPNVLAYHPFDPRWHGSYSLDYGSGSISQVDFRGLNDQSGGDNYLLLSWRVKSTAQFGIDHTSLYVGFWNDTEGGGEGALVRVTLRQTSTGDDPLFPPGTPVARAVGDTPGGTTTPYFEATLTTGSGSNPATWTSPAVTPAWLTDTLRVWINSTANPYNWTVQLRVPLAASIADGINLSASGFKMWSYVQVEALLSATSPPAIVPYTWPRPAACVLEGGTCVLKGGTCGLENGACVLESGACVLQDEGAGVLACATYQSGISQIFPDATTWGDFSLGGVSSCGGVYLANGRIGTRATSNNSKIDLFVDNVFFAEPENRTDTPIPNNVLGATFRIANWGSQVGDLTAASWTAPSALANVTTGPSGGSGTGAPAHGFAAIEGTWNPSARLDDLCPFIGKSGVDSIAGNSACPNPTPTRRLHQCILVDLTAPGLNFLRGSASRNMDFVQTSSPFERTAEISVVGLSDHPAGQRDVFLYVERRNMPRYSPDAQPSDPENDQESVEPATSFPRNMDDIAIAAAVKDRPSFDDIATGMPTWITHAYHDSGKTIRLSDQDFKVLVPQTSFGYFVSHKGQSLGWSDLIAGAERLREDLYRVSPPNGGSVDVNTIVQAVEPGEDPVGYPWPPEAPWWMALPWWFVILILILALFLVVMSVIRRRAGP